MKAKEVDVSVLNIRVGKIVSVERHPNADSLWVEKIDMGEESGPRQVVSGLVKFKTEAQMLGARVLVLANVKPSKMRDVASQGMVLCASNADHTVVDFVVPPEGAALGERVTAEGFDGEPAEVLVPKKKQFEKVAPDLTTDAQGAACYKGVPLKCAAGACASSVPNAHINVPSDLSSVCFYDGVWINSYGPPGDAPSVLAYLRQSPFWDAGSANEALMQRGARDPSDEAELARLAPRTEFVVAEARPPHLFVVQKRRRDAPGARPTLLMQLYVLDGVAYMCPSAGAVVGARVSRAAYRLEKALELFTAEAYADPKEAFS
eukprot:PRCOL_00006676-RA